MSISDNDFASFYPSTIKIIPDKPFERVDDGLVDGELYISVSTDATGPVAKWLRENGAIETSATWSLRHAYFDVPEKLFVLLTLRWS